MPSILKKLAVRYAIDPLIYLSTPWGREVLKTKQELLKSQWLSSEQAQTLSRERLTGLIREVGKNVPFYKRVFGELGLNPATVTADHLAKLPRIDKATIRENFQDFFNSRVDRSSIRIDATGGSSGEPLRFGKDHHRKVVSRAQMLRFRSWTGWRPGASVYLLWAAPTDIAKRKSLGKRIRNWLNDDVLIDSFKLTDELLDWTYKLMQDNPPDLVIGYANTLHVFSRYILDRDLRPLKLNAVISSAGTLYPDQRILMEQALGTKIFNRYGCREMGDISHDCDHHQGMHISSESYHVEIVDQDEEGVGEILVTDLVNVGFPFIRYRIGDRGKLAHEPCSCGRGLPMLAEVRGRTVDFLRMPDGRRIAGEMFPHFFKDFPVIIQGQVIQERPDHITLLLKLRPGGDPAELEPLIERIKKFTGPDVGIQTRLVEEIELTATGKYRPVISNCE